MTAIDPTYLSAPTRRRWPSLSARHVPVVATTLVWMLLILGASLRYTGFFPHAVFVDMLRDNAFLGVAAVGMTFVILSGGIDLSVGAMIGFTSIVIASLTARHGWPPICAIGAALIIGTLVGAAMGAIIGYVELPPFLVTLAGMFLMRGLGFVVSLEQINISNRLYSAFDDFTAAYVPVTTIVFLATLAVGVYVAHHTRFGRAIYAIGGSEASAKLMGIRVPATKVRIYALSGFCAALAGVVFTFNTPSGNANNGAALELDAIAAVVIGGTPLVGGVGYVLGTLMGVMMLGTITSILNFEGTLSPDWAKIATGGLLLAFILLQMGVQRRVGRRGRAAS